MHWTQIFPPSLLLGLGYFVFGYLNQDILLMYTYCQNWSFNFH